MAVNRVDFGGKTLIDLTGDTLESAEQLLKGIIAHAKDGTPIEGTLEAGGGGGGSVEPFTKVITGTVTFAANTTEFALPEAENFLAAYFIRTDFWGVKDDILDSGAQVILFASDQSFGYFAASKFKIASTKYQYRDIINTERVPALSDGKLIFSSRQTFFYGTYYYALLYGTK